MSVGSVSAGGISSQYVQNNPDFSSQALGAPSGGAARAAGQQRGLSPGEELTQGVLQAMQQSGLWQPKASTGVATSSDGSGSQAIDPASGGNPQQAVQQFVYSLFQLAQLAGASAETSGDPNQNNGASGQSGSSGYGGFQNNLQQLLQDVASGAQNDATSSLQAAFQNLSDGTGGQGAQISLQAFMKQLNANLQLGPLGAGSSVGVLINTTA
ncbi:hypothetical protein [Chromobacterium sp. IIBBL 290-4]|uniref:hypothetical protein n=1 Tax=Chromobacterium sp. IIBBL 290-4 TaxID=2953890 RepID=UPI0020B8CD08|nr:hypothetical protein [Chromobacterium sp. IIBBL 290-4]UTH72747.1 hypothetical protein NKT35_14500 [Chromobacterium sp. IIBBL 290-4]